MHTHLNFPVTHITIIMDMHFSHIITIYVTTVYVVHIEHTKSCVDYRNIHMTCVCKTHTHTYTHMKMCVQIIVGSIPHSTINISMILL